jgi:hypothetical protein
MSNKFSCREPQRTQNAADNKETASKALRLGNKQFASLVALCTDNPYIIFYFLAVYFLRKLQKWPLKSCR